MTDEQALEIIRNMKGIERIFVFEDEALEIAGDCLAEEIRVSKRDKKAFGGRCPYTDKECDDFHCWRCEVEKEEQEWLNSEELNDLIGEGFEI